METANTELITLNHFSDSIPTKTTLKELCISNCEILIHVAISFKIDSAKGFNYNKMILAIIKLFKKQPEKYWNKRMYKEETVNKNDLERSP